MKRTLRVYMMLLIALLLCDTTAFAAIPDPSPSFYVTDEADVISSTTEDYIISNNEELQNLCGAQIAVVTVDFLDGMDIEDYAYKLFNEWQIGSAEEDNGVLLLLAIGEENYWCMQGKGLEDDLTAGEIDDMLWYYLEEDFAAADYDEGVKSFFDRMYEKICDIYSVEADAGSVGYNIEGEEMETIYIVVGLIVLVIVIIVIRAAVKSLFRGLFRGLFGGSAPTYYPSRRRPRGHYRPAPRHSPPRPHHRPQPPVRPVSRPKSTPSIFGGLSSGSRSSGTRSGSRSSISRSSGRSRSTGGGGRSRGGGAGRRGR